jgi:hypothetical protein
MVEGFDHILVVKSYKQPLHHARSVPWPRLDVFTQNVAGELDCSQS